MILIPVAFTNARIRYAEMFINSLSLFNSCMEITFDLFWFDLIIIIIIILFFFFFLWCAAVSY